MAADATSALSFSCTTHHKTGAPAPHTEAVLASIRGVSKHTRIPLDLVAVVDRSGSMSGPKLALVKQGLQFIIKQMSENDTLGLVTFDTQVKCEFSSLKMDHKGKQEAVAKCDTIRTGGSTNLSGGLIQGLSEIPPQAQGDTRSASVLIFTDGVANAGVTTSEGIVHCMEGAKTQISRPYSVYSFGFGGDHCADTLRAISDSGEGLYYYLDSLESISTSFGDCLGGLLSVVAQNVTLECRPLAGSIQPPRDSGYAVQMTDGSCKLTVGDINSEEVKDIVFFVDAPVADDDIGDSVTSLCEVELQLFCLETNKMQRISHVVELKRSADEASWALNLDVEEHLLRVKATQAIDDADSLARRHDMATARARLTEACDMIVGSPVAASPALLSLQRDLSALRSDFASAEVYHTVGSKRSRETSMVWKKQKSANTSGTYFRTPNKGLMRDAFTPR